MNRKTLAILIILLTCALLLLVACGESEDPEATLDRFLRAVFEGDTELASALATRRLSTEELDRAREDLVGVRGEMEVSSLSLEQFERDEQRASFIIREVRSRPPVDNEYLDGESPGITLEKQGGRWKVLVPTSFRAN